MTDERTVAEIAGQVRAELADPTGSRVMQAVVPAGVDLVNDPAALADLRGQIARMTEVGR